MSFAQKILYSPLHKSNIDEIAKKMDNKNKNIMTNKTFTTAFPDFSRVSVMQPSTIYHVDGPGWFFKIPANSKTTLSDTGMNGIILASEAYKIDVYHDAHLNKMVAKKGTFTRVAKFVYANAKVTTGKNGEGMPDPPDKSSMCKLVLPRYFDENFIQSKRMTYVDYAVTKTSNGGSCCQIIPVLPLNYQGAEYTTGAWHTVYWDKGKNFAESNNPAEINNTTCASVITQLQTETPGMYVMHCKSNTVTDNVLFVPAKCATAGSITEVRSALSDCNIQMLSSSIDKDTGEAKPKKLASKSNRVVMSYISIPTNNKYWDHLPVPTNEGTEKGVFSDLHAYAYPLNEAFDDEWKNSVYSIDLQDDDTGFSWVEILKGAAPNFRVYAFNFKSPADVTKKDEESEDKKASSSKWPVAICGSQKLFITSSDYENIESDSEYRKSGAFKDVYKPNPPNLPEWLDLNVTEDSFTTYP